MKRLSVVLNLGLLIWACGACSPAMSPTSPSVAPPVTSVAPPSVSQAAPTLYTLSGVVSEMTPAGLIPVESAAVEAYSCDAFNKCIVIPSPSTRTDRNGFYSIPGVNAGKSNWIWAGKAGYDDSNMESPPCEGGCHTVAIDGDTRYDVQLVRR